jgi:hypothetical protein
MRTCTKCGTTKKESDFRVKQKYHTKSGPKVAINNLCWTCAKISAKESKIRNPYTWIKTKFRISKEEAEFWYIESRKHCEICGISCRPDQEALCIDHDHSTGKIRGILCRNCNHLLGHAKDNIKILENSIEYLRRAGN